MEPRFFWGGTADFVLKTAILGNRTGDDREGRPYELTWNGITVFWIKNGGLGVENGVFGAKMAVCWGDPRGRPIAVVLGIPEMELRIFWGDTNDVYYIPCYMPPHSFVAFDVETTGLDAEKDEIIDIALVHFENGSVAATLDFLVRPQKELSSFVNYLTGISQGELSEAKPFKEIAPQILEFISGRPLVAHNAAFDSKIFTLALSRNGFKNNEFVFWDSLAIAQAAWTYESHKLVNLVKQLNIEVSASHRALPDAEACGKVFLLGLAELEKNSDSVKENLRRIAAGTAYESLFKGE
ncbi:MAG: 3'-5' exonuclease [Candidatus Fibromonas sp.]|nr:3'-5' exonuclease [Candidatus Fibromonas sp.]